MKKVISLILFAGAALLPLAARADTRAELLTSIETNLPTNGARQITAAGLRSVLNDLANSAHVPETDGVSVVTSGSYADPGWMTALGWSKITGTPTTLAGYGITDAETPAGAQAKADAAQVAAIGTAATDATTKANAAQAAAIQRANHTGTQTISTVTGLQTALDQSRRAGGYVAFIGDSLTDYGEGYPWYAEILSLGAFRIAAVKSYAGYTTTAIINDNKVADITSLSPAPQCCVVLLGTNDAIAAVSIATFKANVVAIFDSLRSVGITPVVCTLPPLTGSRNSLARQYNEFLRRYALLNRLPLVDHYKALVDPATGNMLAAYDSGDGIHYTAAGGKAMGQATADSLVPLLPPLAPPLADANTGGINLLSNAWLSTDTNADGISDGWSASASSGFGYSRVLDTRGWYWQRVTLAAASGQKQLIGTTVNAGGSTFAVGDRLRVAARIRNGQAGTGKTMLLQFTCYGAGFVTRLNTILSVPVGMTQQINDGVVVKELTVPEGTDFVLMTFLVGAGDGTYDFALPTIHNLTANSLL